MLSSPMGLLRLTIMAIPSMPHRKTEAGEGSVSKPLPDSRDLSGEAQRYAGVPVPARKVIRRISRNQ